MTRNLLALGLLVSATAEAHVSSRLVPGQPVEGRLLVGGKISWHIEMQAEQYAEVAVALRTGSVRLLLRGPDGTPVAEDAFEAEHGSGARGFVSAVAGPHTIELRSRSHHRATEYQVTLVLLRAAESADRRRIEAQELEAALRREEHAAHEGEAAAPWIERNRQMVALYDEVGDALGSARALTRLALALDDLGDSRAALEALEQALEKSRGHGAAFAEALNWLGFMCLRVAEYERALEYLQTALPLARAGKDRALTAAVLGNLGSLYGVLKEERQALRCNRQALALTPDQASGDTLAIVHNIGVTYLTLGEPVQARPYFVRALQGWRALGDKANAGLSLTLIALIDRRAGRVDDAHRELLEALPLVQSSGNRQDEISTRLELGETHLARREFAPARAQLERAAELLKSLDSTGHPDVFWWVPLAFSRLYAEEGRYAEARRSIDATIALVESSRTAIASQGLRAMYSASVGRVYDLAIDLLMREHAQHPEARRDREALEMAERSRARNLLEMLNGAHVDLESELGPDLAAEARRLYDKLDAKADLQMRRLAAGNSAAGAALEDDLRQTSAELTLIEARLREQNPRYGAIVPPDPITAPEIQALLDPDTALLEYSLGRERSYVWLVTADSVVSHALPKEGSISRLARELHDRLTARNREDPKLTARERLAARAAADREYGLLAARLAGVLLTPVGRIEKKRLVIVADGALHHVPFAALPLPSGRPLLADYEIVNLPSAAVLAAVRREAQPRESAPRSLFVFADPVFDRSDPRVRAAAAGRTAPSFPESEDAVFARLAYTRALADDAVFRLSGEQVRKAVDFEANRDAAMGPDLAQYRAVLFATHGVLNSQYPELSGVALSLVDAEGRRQNGFLRLHDIYGMKLNADAVVLAGCETGLGKEMTGEGVVGLSRGFLYAGARRVAATLWKVDEAATVELVRAFLRAALRDGHPYAAALREAQLQLRSRPEFRAPYFWAAFTLQGEWR